jgi:hypothetical protein
MSSHPRRGALSLVTAVALAASACGTGTGTGGSGASGPGFDCPALRDKQAAASCPKFDPGKYLTDCEQTKAAAASCRGAMDAFANCILGQPITCTASGTVDDTTPPACQPQEAATSACFTDAGVK